VLLRQGELTTLDEERIMRHVEPRALDMVRGASAQTQTYNVG
jgi:hypothetical protein